MNRACTIDGCEASAERDEGGARGYCRAHYKRWYRHGDPLAGGSSPGAGIQWLLEHVAHTDEGECLAWPFGGAGEGGRVEYQGRKWVASRLMCTLAHGDPPTERHEAAHSCGKGHEGCVNPRHLDWKTSKENHADRFVHGTVFRGEQHAQAKLTNEQARHIVSLKGSAPLSQIAADFNISQSLVSMIQSGKKWSHVR